MRTLSLFVLGLTVALLTVAAPAQTPSAQQAVAAVLDDFHLAASQADGPRYFAHFAPQAVFLGTDQKERWTLEQFRAYAMPHFSRGRGWTYRPTFRHVALSDDGQTAWFDERLESAAYGDTRGSGVLIWDGQRWLIAQYHLTVPVPNELLESVVRQIHAQP